MIITYEEAKAIEDWVLHRVGYISHEFDPGVHKFLERLALWIKECEKEINNDRT